MSTVLQPASNTLGTIAKSIHAGRKPAPLSGNPQAAKLVRYTLLRTAQSLLWEKGAAPNAQHRTCWCHRSLMGDQVGVYRSESGQARISGLNTCGSVWSCPVCSAKICEARRRELSQAMTGWVATGGRVALMTLTFPHERDHALLELTVKFTKALQAFMNSRTFKNISSDAGRAGLIRSLEVTVGVNGWHPHTHSLLFLARELDEDEIAQLKRQWVNILLKNGLGDASKITWMMERALDIRGGEYAAEYIAKFGHDSAWGMSSEVTKPHAKLGGVKQNGDWHATPFQLLTWAEERDVDGNWTQEAAMAAAQFREFSAVFKGKRMLSWSRGLRKKLNLAEQALDDEVIAAADEPMPAEERVGNVNQEQFTVLLKTNHVGKFLSYVAECCFDPESGQQDIDDYIAAVAALPKTHSSTYRQRNHFGPGYSVLN